MAATARRRSRPARSPISPRASPRAAERHPRLRRAMTDTSGLTQLGRMPLPASPDEAVLETRAQPASRACSISCASPARNSPRSARSPASPISPISSSTTCPRRLTRREQVAEALSRLVPQSRRLPRGLHPGDRPPAGRGAGADWLRIGGYWYPRGGIPIDVFYQTGEPPDGLWLPDPGVAPYRGRG